MILHDLFDWTNSGVGMAGLALTVGAIWQATGAKRAAGEARLAVFRRNASDDVKRLERIASGLLMAIETEQYDLASHQARDFISECLNVREHHRARLGMGGGKLKMAFGVVCAISSKLQAGPKQDDLLKMIESAQMLVGDMSSLAGTLNRRSEEEVQ